MRIGEYLRVTSVNPTYLIYEATQDVRRCPIQKSPDYATYKCEECLKLDRNPLSAVLPEFESSRSIAVNHRTQLREERHSLCKGDDQGWISIRPQRSSRSATCILGEEIDVHIGGVASRFLQLKSLRASCR